MNSNPFLMLDAINPSPPRFPLPASPSPLPPPLILRSKPLGAAWKQALPPPPMNTPVEPGGGRDW